MNSKMRKYKLEIFGKKGKLLNSQDIQGAKDIIAILGYLRDYYPDWNSFTVTKKGLVQDYER